MLNEGLKGPKVLARARVAMRSTSLVICPVIKENICLKINFFAKMNNETFFISNAHQNKTHF